MSIRKRSIFSSILAAIDNNFCGDNGPLDSINALWNTIDLPCNCDAKAAFAANEESGPSIRSSFVDSP